MFGGDILEAGGTHRTGTKHDLTCSGVEGFEEFDDARHCVRREEAEVDDHFEIVPECKCVLSGENGELSPVLDPEMLHRLEGRDSICPRARAQGRRSVRRWLAV